MIILPKKTEVLKQKSSINFTKCQQVLLKELRTRHNKEFSGALRVIYAENGIKVSDYVGIPMRLKPDFSGINFTHPSRNRKKDEKINANYVRVSEV